MYATTWVHLAVYLGLGVYVVWSDRGAGGVGFGLVREKPRMRGANSYKSVSNDVFL